MRQVNIHEAKTHLSRLVEEVARGEGVIIAKAGKPVARLVPLEAQTLPPIGFMAGTGLIEWWDSLDHAALDKEIEESFLGSGNEPERDTAPDVSKRVGIAEGLRNVPDDFDTMFADEIAESFGIER